MVECHLTSSVNYPYNNLQRSGTYLASQSQCCSLCQNTTGCLGFVWLTRIKMCAMKSSVSAPSYKYYQKSNFGIITRIPVEQDSKYKVVKKLCWLAAGPRPLSSSQLQAASPDLPTLPCTQLFLQIMLYIKLLYLLIYYKNRYFSNDFYNSLNFSSK